MTNIAMTGGRGFLGWHTRAVLYEKGIEASLVSVGEKFDSTQAKQAINGAEKLIHIAGINRADDDEIREGNLSFARQLVDILLSTAASMVKPSLQPVRFFAKLRRKLTQSSSMCACLTCSANMVDHFITR